MFALINLTAVKASFSQRVVQNAEMLNSLFPGLQLKWPVAFFFLDDIFCRSQKMAQRLAFQTAGDSVCRVPPASESTSLLCRRQHILEPSRGLHCSLTADVASGITIRVISPIM